MTYHAIPRVPKCTCTAEQKIAYNIAHNLWGTYGKQYSAQRDKVAGWSRSDFFHEITQRGVHFQQQLQARQV